MRLNVALSITRGSRLAGCSSLNERTSLGRSKIDICCGSRSVAGCFKAI